MILQIPLIQQGQRAEKTTTVESTVEEEASIQTGITKETTVETPLMQQGQRAEKTTTVESTVEEEASIQTGITKETTVETADLPPINDDILEEIMSSLREDPDIRNFFDDLDFQFDDCPLW